MTDVSLPPSASPVPATADAPALLPGAPKSKRYDRSIVEGPLSRAVWKIAWPAMLTNVIGGFQGIIDHVMVGHLVGFTGNAAIGVSWQIFIVIIAFIGSLFTGMSVLVARFAGAGEEEKVDHVLVQQWHAGVLHARRRTTVSR